MVTLTDALRYHGLGWSVIPMKPRSKQPKLRSWKPYQTERAAETLIAEWFPEGSDLNLAVVLGDVSGGLVCRDFDTLDSFKAWAALFPRLAATLPTVETSRGRHVYFLAEIDQIRGTGKSASILTLGDGELRAGGLCVLPPSTHPTGRPYRWLIPPTLPLPRADIRFPGRPGRITCNREGQRGTEEDRENRSNRRRRLGWGHARED